MTPAIIGEGAADCASLLSIAEIDEWDLSEQDIADWLAYALKRRIVVETVLGMVTVKSPGLA